MTRTYQSLEGGSLEITFTFPSILSEKELGDIRAEKDRLDLEVKGLERSKERMEKMKDDLEKIKQEKLEISMEKRRSASGS